MWHRILTLFVKELITICRDPNSRMVLIAPPTIQLLILAFATTLEVKNTTLLVLNEDAGTVGRDLVARFEGTPIFTRVIHMRGVDDLKRALDGRVAIAALHIPADFSRDVIARKPAQVQLLLDGRRSNSAQILSGYGREIVARFINERLAHGPSPPGAPSTLRPRVWFNPNGSVIWSSVPDLVATLTTIIGLVITSLSVARERELGTLEQLLISPLSSGEIIVGKTLPALLLGLMEATVMLVFGRVLLGVPVLGSLLLLYGSITVYLLAVIGVGLFISALAVTQQQAILGGTVFIVPSILLSGYASPIENMPDWLQVLTYGNPLRYFMIIVKGIMLKNMPFDVVFVHLWPLAVIASVTLLSASWLFRQRMK